MLKDLLESNFDAQALGFFLAAPSRAFSPLELSKRLRIPHLKLTRVLNNLAKHDFLLASSKFSRKYYRLNTHHKLLPELKSASLRAGLKYQDELFSAIRELGKIKAAFLSGVFAGLPHLPVDLLLVGRVNLSKLDKFLKSAEKLMGVELNYSIMSVNEFIQRRDTFDRFIKDIFDYRHLVVVDQLSTKR